MNTEVWWCHVDVDSGHAKKANLTFKNKACCCHIRTDISLGPTVHSNFEIYIIQAAMLSLSSTTCCNAVRSRSCQRLVASATTCHSVEMSPSDIRRRTSASTKRNCPVRFFRSGSIRSSSSLQSYTNESTLEQHHQEDPSYIAAQRKLSLNLIPADDFGSLREYSVIHTDRSLNLMSDPFQHVMKDLNSLLKVTYNADKTVIVPGYECRQCRIFWM